MARLEYFVAAQSVSVDQATNRTSVFNVLETLTPPKFPFYLQEVAVVALWRKEPADEGKDFQAIVRVSGAVVNPVESAANFQMREKRHRIILTIEGLPLAGPGDVKFELLLNGAHQAEHILTVVHEPSAGAAS